MSKDYPAEAGGGSVPTALAAALIIDADLERHILLRRALRRTDLFGLILSAESADTAEEILHDPETPELSLILASDALRAEVLGAASAAQTRRLATVGGASSHGSVFPKLLLPVTPGDVETLMKKLG